MENKIGIFSFFSGAGFLDLGFEKTGLYEILYANEIHKPFMDIYKYARKQMKIKSPQFGYSLSDITTFLNQETLEQLKNNVNIAKKEYPFVGFIGGPPCPDFSVAGKNKGKEGDNGKLSGTYVDLICLVQPDFFLFENVKGLYRTKKHREFFDEIKVKMNEAGYFMTEKLINAIEYGAPQDRERIILIGFHKETVKKLSLKTSDKELSDFNWENKKYELVDILNKQWPKTTPFSENSEMISPNGIIKELTVQYWFDKNDVEHHPNSNQYFVPRQGLQRFLEIEEGDDKKKSYKRLHRWRYSPTAAYGNNEVHLHPYKPRRLSISEALAIQSLPKEFVLPLDITLTNAFKAIGNGVPYMAARGLALNIFDYVNKHLSKQQENG
ncbi:DNA cytosine methyltransferase [Parabacteroides merdae]|uniref:DNA (cytosine-5-)-methyltransferase n=1 Tax=Parabacteroides merdae TaxID=46503 RepID=A0A7K1HHL8_9BACT|nr:DNA cytosine methyltransferase [Parabacteroides merdae]MTU30703.1 DNA (cytosine-5-)-methyltransferase [Parabacteroides merdae]RYS82577.1 DNA cytosine methyltransferase [Parabacteroides merdae]